MTLYGAAKAPGDALREAGTTVVALTDSSGGSAAETLALGVNIAALTNSVGGTPADTLAVATNTADLTNSTGGTPNDVLAAATNITALTDSTGGATVTTLLEIVPGGGGATAGAFSSSTTRDAAIVMINDNFKALTVAAIAQKLVNTSLTNAVASLADKISDLLTHLNDGR